MCVYIYNRQYSIVYGLSWSSIPCHANPKITGIDDHSEILPKLDSALRWRVRLLSSQDTDLSMGESSMLFFEPTNQPANMSNLSDATSGFPALLNFSHISPKEDVNIYIYMVEKPFGDGRCPTYVPPGVSIQKIRSSILSFL